MLRCHFDARQPPYDFALIDVGLHTIVMSLTTDVDYYVQLTEGSLSGVEHKGRRHSFLAFSPMDTFLGAVSYDVKTHNC